MQTNSLTWSLWTGIGGFSITHHTPTERAVPVSNKCVCHHKGDGVRVGPPNRLHCDGDMGQRHLVITHTDLEQQHENIHWYYFSPVTYSGLLFVWNKQLSINVLGFLFLKCDNGNKLDILIPKHFKDTWRWGQPCGWGVKIPTVNLRHRWLMIPRFD